MVIQNETVKKLIDKYGDDLYRFAFVLTCSDEGAASLLAASFSNLEGEKKFTEDDSENRLMMLSEIYKNAAGDEGARPAAKYYFRYTVDHSILFMTRPVISLG